MALAFCIVQTASAQKWKAAVTRANSVFSYQNDQYFEFDSKEKYFSHGSLPWSTYDNNAQGELLIKPNQFQSYTATAHRKQTYTQFDSTALSLYDATTATFLPRTIQQLEQYPFVIAQYTPKYLLEMILQQPGKVKAHKQKDGLHVTYAQDSLNSYEIIIKNNKVTEARYHYTHDIFGDATTSITYAPYVATAVDKKQKPAYYSPLTTTSEFGKVMKSTSIKAVDHVKPVVSPYVDSSVMKAMEEVNYEPVITQYQEHIYLLEFKGSSSRSNLIEFNDYFLVADAPLNTKFGDAIVNAAKMINPEKPIRYFSFTHHHPWSIGGMRSLVAAGATVFTHPTNAAFINEIVNFPHTLQPDSLSIHPVSLKTESIETVRTLKDSTLEMQIIHIGAESEHTDDYFVYYFPQLQLLIEGDLVWIANNGDMKPAIARQKGLYDAIVKRNLAVKKIMQNWPIMNDNYKVKSMVTFTELENSVKLLSAKQ